MMMSIPVMKLLSICLGAFSLLSGGLQAATENPRELATEHHARLKEVVLELYHIGAIRLGSFQLKNGSTSSIYIDMRTAISRPSLVKRIAELLWELIDSRTFDRLCGVPYGALPWSTAMAIAHDIPMVMVRKESKSYGTCQQIDGVYIHGDKVLLIEDVMTSGGSIATTADLLTSTGMVVSQVVVFLDRQQGGAENLASKGLKVNAVVTLQELLAILHAEELLTEPSVPQLQLHEKHKERLSYGDRAALCNNPVSRELFTLMEQKQTNLAASADISDKAQLLNFADAVGPYICLLKTHADIIEDFDDSFIQTLREIAHRHHFLLFEDRKFADIGHTVKRQYGGGIHKIASWAHIINAHCIAGPGTIHALKEVGATHAAALLLIPQLSTADALTDAAYAEKTLQIAREHSDYVVGFIARQRLTSEPHFMTMTPGVHMTLTADNMDQQYLTPARAIGDNLSDIIIVGRGLYAATDWRSAAAAYRTAGWQAYRQRIIE